MVGRVGTMEEADQPGEFHPLKVEIWGFFGDFQDSILDKHFTLKFLINDNYNYCYGEYKHPFNITQIKNFFDNFNSNLFNKKKKK